MPPPRSPPLGPFPVRCAAAHEPAAGAVLRQPLAVRGIGVARLFVRFARLGEAVGRLLEAAGGRGLAALFVSEGLDGAAELN